MYARGPILDDVLERAVISAMQEREDATQASILPSLSDPLLFALKVKVRMSWI